MAYSLFAQFYFMQFRMDAAELLCHCLPYIRFCLRFALEPLLILLRRVLLLLLLLVPLPIPFDGCDTMRFMSNEIVRHIRMPNKV